MKKSFLITTSQLGRDVGLFKTEELIVDEKYDTFQITPSGDLLFIINGDMVAYAKGMWVIITSSNAD